jgi:asparagine synthase (glutamine-hydrolysing)
MCGIAGIIWKTGGVSPETTASVLGAFEPLITHRGPDERGVHVEETFGVVHRRLAIIDITSGQQPMFAAGGAVGIVYNGEVYNHQALRKELEAKGHIFATHCDTEVVLAMYLEYGVDSFTRLDGMFVFCIWDKRGGEPVFFLGRDHLGTKPLYVYEDDQRIAFSSEIRPLLGLPNADIGLDPIGIQSYLAFRYVQAPRTLYRRIRRMEAGSYWQVRGARVLRTRYWDLPVVSTPTRISEAEAAEQLASLLRASVSAQQMSEVPVGLLLSGGLDSSVIACLCGELGVRLKSFNIGFPTVNEFKYSGEMARTFGLDHVTVECTPEQIVGRFDCVVEAMDDPIADPACFPLHILCDEIAKSVTVVLSGEGADEMFSGYPQYMHRLASSPAGDAAQFRDFLRDSWYFADDIEHLAPGASSAALKRNASYFHERPLLEGMLAYDMKTWLPENLLMKADKILMSHSLEGRFPFLAKDIVEFASTLPESMKVDQQGGKRLLRMAFSKRLPQNILKRPKMGFSVPLDVLAVGLQERLYSLLDAARTSELAAHLDMIEVRRRVDAHYNGQLPNALWVWTMLVMLEWLTRGAGVSRMLPLGAAGAPMADYAGPLQVKAA